MCFLCDEIGLPGPLGRAPLLFGSRRPILTKVMPALGFGPTSGFADLSWSIRVPDPDPSDTSDVRPVADVQPDGDAAEGQVAGYRLLRRLGRGAMAEVYLAEQCSLRRHVALKVLRANLASEQSYVKRFQLEAQAAASLVHPNIVQIYEVGCQGGLHFIAQEYVPGLNLREWLARNGSAPLPLALGVVRQVAAALAKASHHGIVHRDIKPDNIMVSSSGEVKVADFGLARLSTSDTRLTQEGYTLGTPLYMSPEQVEGRPLDTRSDIYSLGVTSYHMLAGQPPFAGDTALQVAVQHLRNEPPPLGQVRADLPAALCEMIHKMLAKDPQHRYSTAHEILRDLRAIYAACGLHVDDHSHTSLPTGLATVATSREALTGKLQVLMRPEPRAAGRRFWWPAATVVTLAFLAGLAAARFSQPKSFLSRQATGDIVPNSQAPTDRSSTDGSAREAGPAVRSEATSLSGNAPTAGKRGPRDGGGGFGGPGGPDRRARNGGFGGQRRRGDFNRPSGAGPRGSSEPHDGPDRQGPPEKPDAPAEPTSAEDDAPPAEDAAPAN
jgi:eukaryotic-like serine/threonine-protein kinase